MGRYDEAKADIARAIEPTSWFMRGSHPKQYGREVVSNAFEDKPAVRIWATAETTDGFGTLMQMLDPGDNAGKRMRFSAAVKTEDVDGWLGLWMRVDGKGQGPLAFDNMQRRAISGTTGWSRYDVVLDVDEEATAIAFGMLLGGRGSGWITDVRLEPVELDVPMTDSVEVALADLTRAIELNPKDTWALAWHGNTYKETGRYKEALNDLDEAIKLNPKDAWALACRGDTYKKMGHYEEALNDLDKAIELNPKDAWVLAWRGDTYMAMGRYEEALNDLDKAIELDPTSAWLVSIRGQVYLQMGRDDEALAAFTHAITLNPGGEDWYRYCTALIHLRRGDAEFADAELRAAVQMADSRLKRPYEVRVLFNAALYKVALGDYDTALRLYDSGVRDGATKSDVSAAITDLRLLSTITAASEISRMISVLQSGPSTD